MSRYATFKYGAAKYGFTPEAGLQWGLDIDWNNDGVFSGENEALNMRKLKVTRGRKDLLKADGAGFEPVRPGEFVAELLDTSGRYDPYNAASPLYPHVIPGCKFRLRVRDGATGTIYPVMAGWITDINPLSERLPKVIIKGVDGSRLLQDAKVNAGIQSTLGVDDAAAEVLTLAGWDNGTEIEPTAEVAVYWWGNGASALAQLRELADRTLGRFFIAADGSAVYQTRNAAPAMAASLDESDILRGIALPQPWEIVRNAVRVNVNARTQQATSEIWRLRDVPSVQPGESLTIWADYVFNSAAVPALNVISPVATTDYLMNAVSDGSGADLTANFSVSAVLYAEKALLTVTNGGASIGYVTLLKLRGDPLTLSNTSGVSKEDAASIALYRRREFSLDNRWIQNTNVADGLADYIEEIFSQPRAFPLVRLRGKPDKQFALDLFTRVELDFPSRGIADVYFPAYIVHEWDEPSGNVATTTVKFEPYVVLGVDFWQFPTTIGVTSKFAS